MRNGWREVPASRHDGYYMPKGTEGQIVRKGQGLFELPIEMAEERQRLAELRARRQVRDKEAQDDLCSPPGTAPRDAHPKTMPFVPEGVRAGADGCRVSDVQLRSGLTVMFCAAIATLSTKVDKGHEHDGNAG